MRAVAVFGDVARLRLARDRPRVKAQIAFVFVLRDIRHYLPPLSATVRLASWHEKSQASVTSERKSARSTEFRKARFSASYAVAAIRPEPPAAAI
jgi:hypothetical protein